MRKLLLILMICFVGCNTDESPTKSNLECAKESVLEYNLGIIKEGEGLCEGSNILIPLDPKIKVTDFVGVNTDSVQWKYAYYELKSLSNISNDSLFYLLNWKYYLLDKDFKVLSVRDESVIKK